MAPKLALQMYTVRDEAAADFAGTFRRVAAMGYPAVQLAGTGGLSATALRDLLAELGLAVAGAHVALERLEGALDEEIAYQKVLGNRDLVCPSIPAARRQDAAGWRNVAASLAAIGRRCQAANMRLSHHNHAFEFDRVGDRVGLEFLLDDVDPAHLAWEPDVYWVQAAGHDPVAWLKRYAGRCPLVHLKDMTSGPNPTFAEVGEGIIRFDPIFGATTDAEWYIVEQDRCARPPLESAAISLAHLRTWGY